MTERLEEIQSRVWKDKGTYAMGDNKSREGYIYTLSDYDYEWLIKQAERVQKLEKNLDEELDIGLKMEGEANEWEIKAKRYKQALEYIQREIREAIYTPKNNKWNSDFEREFEKGKTRGLIQASDIVKKAIRKLEG